MNFTRKDKIEIFENAISWIVAFAMLVYGGAKIIQFDDATHIDKIVSEMTGMELMWAFYGYSKSYAIILGLMEIIGGIMILMKRTRIIACLFLSTILVNVILQDIFFEISFGALKAALLYQILILIILWINKEQLIQAVKELMTTKKYEKSKNIFLKLIITFGLFVIFRLLEYFITIKWFW